MQDFPVEIQLISRFRTAKEVRETKEGLKSGYVDIVVGTHKLLSKDIQYKDQDYLLSMKNNVLAYVIKNVLKH